jgi:two-component system, cell cycle sensor histidine kinase and response regulator CckA
MAEDSVSLKTSKLAQTLPLPGRSMSLKWKIGAASGGTVLVMGILVLALVYFLTGNALRRQVDIRASAIATNLSDAAAPYISRRGVLELDALVAKYGRLEGVAYAFIQDPKGEILASSAQPFPAELKSTMGADYQTRNGASREITLRGRPVRETRAPVLEGQLGAVHVGIWDDTTQQDVRNTLLPIILLTAICLAMAAVLSVFIAGTVVKPIIELVSAADAMSRGQLDAPIIARTDDEIGELARSIERMRASLKAAITRLSRAQ